MKVLRISIFVLLVIFLNVGLSYAQTPEEYYFKGREYSAQGRFGEAKMEFEKVPAADLFGDSAKRCLELIDTRSKKEFKIYLFNKIGFTNEEIWDELLTKYNTVIIANPDNAEAYYTLAQAYYEIEHYDLAIYHTRRAIELGFKAHPEFLVNLRNKGRYPLPIAEIMRNLGQPSAFEDVPTEKLVTIKYCRVPLRTFEIVGADIKGVQQEQLTEVLKKYQKANPKARFELLAEVNSVTEIVRKIQKNIDDAGIRLKHYWVPTSTKNADSPHGPGFIDILKK